jgi:hypothetical protein
VKLIAFKELAEPGEDEGNYCDAGHGIESLGTVQGALA